MSTTGTSLQPSTPMDSPEHDISSEKQGRSCFGCLCDMRRAVIILSAIGIIASALSVVSNHFFLFEGAKDETEDEKDVNRLNDLLTVNIVLAVLSAVGFAMSIVGGWKFNVPLVLINTVYMPIGFAINNALFLLAASDIEGFNFSFINMVGPLIGVIASLFVHISFIKEVRAGIMSEENYAKEEQSCCCV
mmetsp:Transcript_5057/g.8281  ORF Transcript_5057/g.8281 Transcript_5057/m.8281 type:complete len:190 (+) Transcript_5057:104-673(+)|eukprot:CAMPEP_0119009948 /NCGR_PEP_ID=MMETSP1176-20130426/4691_1 /TAXON_ID=265551 /ORGANISM="Synedropsis recta cf, Strain CCMP1620" /LENGTH=189 /DNA_ID=CAMNT_0006962533 /DNA_START=84 /DNA_END=653 /DNA_ORIENTATION=+